MFINCARNIEDVHGSSVNVERTCFDIIKRKSLFIVAELASRLRIHGPSILLSFLFKPK